MAVAAVADLPAYSGPDGTCPLCGFAGAMTEWHWAQVPPAPQGTAGCRAPCAGHPGLAVWDGGGEHLCRVCLNCGYGWTEACTGPGAPAPHRTPALPTLALDLVCLGSGVVSTGIACMLSLVLGGAALIGTWLAVTVTVSFTAAVAYEAMTGRPGKEHGR